MLGVVSLGYSSEIDGSFGIGVVGVRRGGTDTRGFSDRMGREGVCVFHRLHFGKSDVVVGGRRAEQHVRMLRVHRQCEAMDLTVLNALI